MTIELFDEDAERAERAAAERRRWAEHDADFTPPDVARLGALALREVCGIHPRRILGPCAGAGTWIAAAREMWTEVPASRHHAGRPAPELLAMDIRAEELPHLQHHVAGQGAAAIGDFLQDAPPGEAPDLVLDNLPFKLALDFLRRGMEVVAPGGYVAWFVRMTLGDAKDVNDWLERNPPSYKLEFVDRLKFRAGINPETGKPWSVDSVGYKMLVFRRGSRPYVYMGKRLPSLPAASRRWRKTLSGLDIRPGTEYLHGTDVEHPAVLALR